MAHGFLKRVVASESTGFNAQLMACLAGGFFLSVGFAAAFIYPDDNRADMLTMAAAALLGAPLLFHALRDLATGAVEMNELAALSFVASFATGQYRPAAFIALFMIISQLIELRSQLGARKNIEALMRLAPARARVKRGMTYTEQAADTLMPGDIVQVRPGDRIPGDARVIEGLSTVDEAAITGESIPVEKAAGAEVYSGTVNMTGMLVLEICSAATRSTLEQIKQMIAQAEKSRTPVMRLVNRYAQWYTPVILTLAGIVWFFTRDINRAIAMLIIACPCTVLLSGPTALVAALSAAARLGIIIKSVGALETASRVDTVIFDKTGTLTRGRLRVAHITSTNGLTDSDLLGLAGSLEQYSNHPVAQALVGECARISAGFSPVKGFREHAGCGVTGQVNDKNVAVGNDSWISSLCGSTIDMADSTGSSLHIAVDGKVAGSVTVTDTLRPEACGVLERLRSKFVRTIIMMTGDRRHIAEHIGGQLGCAVEAEVLPGDKLRRVEEIKRQGATVAMVGDGVNDAPALAAGDVAIAMGAAGSDVAIHSASIVLMNEHLDRIPFIFRLSRRVVGTIRQNIAFSIIYILILVALSAAGEIGPVLAAILHTASTVAVMFNSARLLREGEELT